MYYSVIIWHAHYGLRTPVSWALGVPTRWRGETSLLQAPNWLLEVSCLWQRLQIRVRSWASQLMHAGESGRYMSAEAGGDFDKSRPPRLWSPSWSLQRWPKPAPGLGNVVPAVTDFPKRTRESGLFWTLSFHFFSLLSKKISLCTRSNSSSLFIPFHSWATKCVFISDQIQTMQSVIYEDTFCTSCIYYSASTCSQGRWPRGAL